MLRGTVVVRGRSPYPVRTVLPLTVPEHLSRPGPCAGPGARAADAGRTGTAPRRARPAPLVDAPTTITPWCAATASDTVPHGIPRRVPGARRPTRTPAGRARTGRPPSPARPRGEPDPAGAVGPRGATETRRRDRGVADRLARPVPPPAGAARRPVARPPQRRVADLIAQAERDRSAGGTQPRPGGTPASRERGRRGTIPAPAPRHRSGTGSAGRTGTRPERFPDQRVRSPASYARPVRRRPGRVAYDRFDGTTGPATPRQPGRPGDDARAEGAYLNGSYADEPLRQRATGQRVARRHVPSDAARRSCRRGLRDGCVRATYRESRPSPPGPASVPPGTCRPTTAGCRVRLGLRAADARPRDRASRGRLHGRSAARAPPPRSLADGSDDWTLPLPVVRAAPAPEPEPDRPPGIPRGVPTGQARSPRGRGTGRRAVARRAVARRAVARRAVAAGALAGRTARRSGPVREPDRHREPDRASDRVRTPRTGPGTPGHRAAGAGPGDRTTGASRRNASAPRPARRGERRRRRRADRARHRRPDH